MVEICGANEDRAAVTPGKRDLSQIELNYKRREYIKWLGDRIQREVDETTHKIQMQDETYRTMQSVSGVSAAQTSSLSVMTKTNTSVSPSPFQKRVSKRLDYGLRSEQVRLIIVESFSLFRNVELPERKVQEYEERVFCGALFLSPRSAAKAILELMDMFTIEEITQTQSERNSTRIERNSMGGSFANDPEIRSHSLK